jgi:hypothetical protein
VIHSSFSKPSPFSQDPVLHISIVGAEDVLAFQALLNSALNCAAPEKFSQWLKLADAIDASLAPFVPAKG